MWRWCTQYTGVLKYIISLFFSINIMLWVLEHVLVLWELLYCLLPDYCQDVQQEDNMMFSSLLCRGVHAVLMKCINLLQPLIGQEYPLNVLTNLQGNLLLEVKGQPWRFITRHLGTYQLACRAQCSSVETLQKKVGSRMGVNQCKCTLRTAHVNKTHNH